MHEATNRLDLCGGRCWPQLVMDGAHERVDSRPVAHVDLDRLSFQGVEDDVNLALVESGEEFAREYHVGEAHARSVAASL